MKKIIKESTYGVYSFFVDEDKKVVTAVLNPRIGGVDTAMKEINKATHGKFRITEVEGSMKLAPKERYIGVAKCNPVDTFDEITGVRIAEARAYKQYLRDKQRVMLAVRDAIDVGLNRITGKLVDIDDQVERVDYDISRYSR